MPGCLCWGIDKRGVEESWRWVRGCRGMGERMTIAGRECRREVTAADHRRPHYRRIVCCRTLETTATTIKPSIDNSAVTVDRPIGTSNKKETEQHLYIRSNILSWNNNGLQCRRQSINDS